MAEIPVERRAKGAFPWWLIPLLLLLLLLPLLYYTCGRNNTVAVHNANANRATGEMDTAANMTTNAVNKVGNAVGNTVAMTDGAGNMDGGASGKQSAGGTVTAVNFFGFTKDKASLVGRAVDLRSARVNRVLSDKVFTVKSENEEMFVMLDEALDSAGGNENRVKVRDGQTVKLTGTFLAVPTQETWDEAQHGGLKLKDFEQMKNQQAYLHATSIGNAP
jgi:hypothetical protein